MLAASVGSIFGADASDRVAFGVDQLFDDYAQVSEGDGVVIAHSPQGSPGVPWLLLGVGQREVSAIVVPFSYDGESRFASSLSQAIGELRREKPTRRIVVLMCEGSRLSHTGTLKSIADQPGLIVRRLMNCSPDLFALGLTTSSRDLRNINASILELLMPAPSARVVSDAGTMLDVEFDSSYQWVSNYGVPGPGEVIVLPPGEVNTYPSNVNGILVANGAIHTNLAVDFDVRLDSAIAQFRIRDNVVIDFDCANPVISAFLQKSFQRPFATSIGEIGFGTNIGIQSFTAENTHINERHPGVHLGFGEHTQPGRGLHEADVHIDAVAPDTKVIVGDRTIDFSRLLSKDTPHPLGTRCEDLEHIPDQP